MQVCRVSAKDMEIETKEDLVHAILNENTKHKIHTASEDPGVHLVFLQSINLWDTLRRAHRALITLQIHM